MSELVIILTTTFWMLWSFWTKCALDWVTFVVYFYDFIETSVEVLFIILFQLVSDNFLDNLCLIANKL